MTPDLDIDPLRQWIGRTEQTTDIIASRLVKSLRATLDEDPGEPKDGEAAPLAIHWCLAPAIAPAHILAEDGHPTRGGFLPPVPLPRRMWAGSELEIIDSLCVGDVVERQSRITDVSLKEGRTGPLCFVTVAHDYATSRGIALRESQMIVYRDFDRKPAPEAPVFETKPQWRRTINADPVLLFRYSALTFNGHRIHYDRRYCESVEGYGGLVVHGPLQATLLLMLAAATRDGHAPRHFEFRGVNPLIDSADFTVNAIEADDGLELWIANAKSQRTMTGRAKW